MVARGLESRSGRESGQISFDRGLAKGGIRKAPKGHRCWQEILSRKALAKGVTLAL